jgi:dipeptidyl aminopeptidase/acylaminoacyl peptidase
MLASLPMRFVNPLLPVRFRFALIVVLLLSFCSLIVPACAQSTPSSPSSAPRQPDPRIGETLSQLEKVRNFRQTALSPDGKQIAWVVDTAAGGTEIQLAHLQNPAETQPVTAVPTRTPSCEEGDVAWSPDGNLLAFLSNCQTSHQYQIYVQTVGSKQAPVQKSQLNGFVQALQWSPDGQNIGFLYVENATRRAGALDAMKPPSGVMGEDDIEIQREAAITEATGQLRILTPANLHVYEFDWSPDSKSLAYVAAPPPGENNWWVAQLYTQQTGSSEPAPILDPGHTTSPLHGLQIAVPRWSPDGKYIALIGGLMSDQGSTGGDIYVLPATGGEPRPVVLTTNRSSTPSWIYWKNTKTLGVSLVKNGNSAFTYVDVFSGQDTKPEFDLPASVEDGRLEGSLSFASDGEVAQIRSSWAQAPEVFAGKFGGEFRQVTHVNDALKPTWGEAESITWTSDAPTGKFDVQGWLLYPANYDPAKKYPMIVSVHGGPAAAMVPRWPGVGFNASAFSPLGYFVLFPNPRGSYGSGEAFTLANRKDFGYGDLHDIVAGVDAVVAKYPVDGNRVGLTGWSYGGFMTMFAVTQTNRFHAAVAGAGISNWQSYYGENSIDQWMVPYFGASVYEDPVVYYKSSAINFIRQVKTPTLVVVGDRDGECPAPQSFEFWHALKAQHVPTKLVVYPNEGHRFVSPEHRRDVMERALEWFEEYMPDKQ